MKKTTYLILFLLCFSQFMSSQNDTSKFILYDFSFLFNDGIYTNFDDFKSNNPIPIESIISPNCASEDIFSCIDTASFIKYNDGYGIIKEININEIWGYSKNGKPYKYWDDKFYLIPIIGTISHFAANIKVLNTYNSPYSYSLYGSYSAVSVPIGKTYESEELHFFIIDMNDGTIMNYTRENVEMLLKRDSEIYENFMKLSKRKRNKEMFQYVNTYNKKHRLYIQK